VIAPVPTGREKEIFRRTLLAAGAAETMVQDEERADELLEMIGVGTALPLLNAYAQSGADIVDPALAILPGATLMALSSALASGLADEESDCIGGKRTFASMLGNGIVRRATEASLISGIVLWLIAGLVTPMPLVVVLPGSAVAAFFVPRLLSTSRRARTNAFSAIRRYKQELHRAIWWSGVVVAATLAIYGLIAVGGLG